MFAYCNNNPVNQIDSTGTLPKWINGALSFISGTTQVIAGFALGATVGWTGVGAIAAGFLVTNGFSTAFSGFSQVINDAFDSTLLPEENLLKTAVEGVGYLIAGDKGAKIGGAVYEVVNLAATVYSIAGGSSTALTKTANAFGKYPAVAKSTFSMLPASPFFDTYKVTQPLTPIISYIQLPKTWYRVANGIGAATDIIIGVFGE